MEFVISKGEARAKCSTKGGELVSFVKDGVEYVWQGDPQFWSGQAPCLFPVVCRAKEDRSRVNGSSYPMKKHGIARKAEYTPIDVRPDSITMRLSSDEETKKSYPFSFNLDITHSITENGFRTEYKVTDTDTHPMIFCVGGHPGFNCPMRDGEKFEDYSLVFDNAAGAAVHNTEQEGGYMSPDMPQLDVIKDNVLPLCYKDFALDAIVVENLPVKKVNLVNRNTGHGIRFEFDSFDAIGFWTPVEGGAPFICLEPWNGLPGSTAETPDFTSKKYAKIIEAGESFVTAYSVGII